MYQAEEFDHIRMEFIPTLQNLRAGDPDENVRTLINRTVYTIQQTIGAALDGLPIGESNRARKINGTLFENFIRLILIEIGVDATCGLVRVPVFMDGQEQFKMNFQHDLIINFKGETRAIGSVKTSSKDRIGKIFIDKFLYSRLTGGDLPHIAVFLNDVQRAGKAPNFGISPTFSPGHFKGYTVKLNPLNGVYYCDIRPNMITEPILRDHIKTLDHLLCTDIWQFLKHKEHIPIEIVEDTDNQGK